MDTISYQELLDEAMLGIVRKVLSNVEQYGLDGDQSFYISFRTDYPGVILSNHVKSKYPKEITIVLQYQYRDLAVYDEYFSVNIAFGGIPETVTVPFDALTNFVDPTANFSLQFRRELDEDDLDELEELLGEDFEDHVFGASLEMENKFKTKKPKTPQSTREAKKKDNKPGEVIALDQFRRKKKK